jgi:uncharacterized RDD family membrane protein YckC
MEQTDAIALEFAGFWRRFAAFIIDAIAISILTSIVLPFHNIPHFWNNVSAWYFFPLMAINNFLSTLITIAYPVVFWTWRGQTPGKMVMNIKVIRTDGSNITLGYALLRYLGYIVCCLTIGIGFLWIAFDARKQGLHDKIADTYVVKLPTPALRSAIPAAKPSAG